MTNPSTLDITKQSATIGLVGLRTVELVYGTGPKEKGSG